MQIGVRSSVEVEVGIEDKEEKSTVEERKGVRDDEAQILSTVSWEELGCDHNGS